MVRTNLSLLSDAYFDNAGPFKRNIELYGAIPAYGNIHNTNGPLVILTDDKPDYDSIEINEDDDDDVKIVNIESTMWKQKNKKNSI